jgi:hypothetical protein
MKIQINTLTGLTARKYLGNSKINTAYSLNIGGHDHMFVHREPKRNLVPRERGWP